MEKPNQLNNDILNTQKKKYDAACKRLLSQKIILAQILKNCVKEFANCNINDIAYMYIEGEPQIAVTGVNPNETNKPLIQGYNTESNSINEGKISYDILFYTIAPGTGEPVKIIINVEAQRNTTPGYPITKRALYYCSRLISAQYGREFTNSQYDKIKKVYSIWICLDVPEVSQNTITNYTINENLVYGENKEKPKNYDIFTATIIHISKDVRQLDNKIIELLSVLLSDSLPANQIIDTLNNKFNIPVTENLETEVLNMCNLSEAIEERGIEKGKKETAFEMYKNGLSIQQIALFSKISMQKAEEWVKEFAGTIKKSCI